MATIGGFRYVQTRSPTLRPVPSYEFTLVGYSGEDDRSFWLIVTAAHCVVLRA